MRVWAAWFGSAIATVPLAAHARGSAHVIYTYPAGDPSCPDEATLRGMIASQLGYEPFQAASSTKVEASIERTSGRLRGRVVLVRCPKSLGGGIAPAASFGAAVAVGIHGTSMSLSLEARGDLPAFAPMSSGGELGASVALGAIVPCIHLRRFVVCGIVAAGSMRGEARGVAIAASDYGFYGAAGARVGVEIPLSRAVALRPEVDGLVAWARPGIPPCTTAQESCDGVELAKTTEGSCKDSCAVPPL